MEDKSIWKKFALACVFFFFTPVVIALSIISLSSVEKKQQIANSPSLIQAPQYGVQAYASLPETYPQVKGAATEIDARSEIIRQFMATNNSPMTDYANYIVEMADKYEIDYRLLVAIAQKESGLCRVIPPGGYNCWGWGIHSEGTLGFDSYEESIEAVSKGIREEYVDKGYVTVDEIQKKWIAHSPGGIWAIDVQSYFDQITQFD